MLPTTLNRAMLCAEDNLPVLGDTREHLGALFPGDIAPDAEGMVEPNQGGMSIYWGNPRHMPKSRRPRSLGGEGEHPLFQASEDYLPATLVVDRDGERKKKPTKHATVQPRVRCHHSHYQDSLHGTRLLWQLHRESDNAK